jgi:hypothetical protein
MATVNKDFKIKSGLVVEGTTGTINGLNILTESQDSQDFILDLIGGETLVKSVSAEFDVSVAGELSLDRATVDAYYDAAGSATTAYNDAVAAAASDATDKANAAQTAAELTASNALTTAVNDLEAYADQAELDAVSTANSYTDGEITTALSTAQGYADAAESDAVTTANAYTDGRETAITTAYQSYADTAEQDAKDYADAAVAAIVDGAPELLDTLNELAAALQDNPDVIANIQDVAAGKQDALTAGANIDITDDVISVTGLDSEDISDFSTAAVTANTGLWDTVGAAAAAQEAAEDYADGLAVNYDAAGSAATAEQNAKDYADTLAGGLDTDDIEEGSVNLYFTDGRAKTSAAELLTGATLENITITGSGSGLTITAENGVADSTTDDLVEGETNLYFTDSRAVDALEAVVPNFTAVELNSVAKQVAATLEAATAGIQVGHAFAKADYRSAEYLVKVAYGDHTEISKVLLTLDVNDNIAITEYGIVGTNGSASTISAGISGTDVQLLVTTANNNSTVTVMGTLLV